MLFFEPACLVKVTERLLVQTLAAAEDLLDAVGLERVVNAGCSVGFDILHDGVGKRVDVVASIVAHGEINFVVGSHFVDVGSDGLAENERLIET